MLGSRACAAITPRVPVPSLNPKLEPRSATEPERGAVAIEPELGAADGRAAASAPAGWKTRLSERLWSSRRRRSITSLLAGLLLLPCLLVLLFLCDRAVNTGRVLRGVQLGPLALSGMDADAVSAALEPRSSALADASLRLAIGATLVELEAEAVGLHVDLSGTVGAALGAGREPGLGRQLSWWLSSMSRSHALHWVAKLDDQRFEAELSRLGALALKQPPFDGAIVLDGEQLVAKPPRRGWVIDHEATRLAVLAAFSAGTQGRGLFARAALVEVEPATTPQQVEAALERARRLVSKPIKLENSAEQVAVDFGVADLRAALGSRSGPKGLELFFKAEAIEAQLKPLRKNLEDEPRNARFSVERDQIKIEPSRAGTLLDAAAVAAELLVVASAGKTLGELPIQRSAPPAFTTEDAEALGIRRLVSSFTTYHACCQPRVQNIHLIADLLNDTIVKPGERFSVNEYIGPRTHGKGFVEAPTISRGEMVDTYGGGISQFATTMFNAILDGGYEIIQRQPHSYYFSRYPEGHEATLSFPVPDLIFRNDSASGLLIKTEKGPTFIRVKIFGDNGGRKVRRFISRRFDIVKPEVEYEVDDDLDPDQEKVLYGGMDGWSVVATRIITYPDGKKTDEGRKVVYKPRSRIVKVHSCNVPKGSEGYTGDPCPKPEEPDAGAEAPEPDAGAAGDLPAPASEPPE